MQSIGDRAFGYDNSGAISGFTIIGHPGTAAETYAAENGFVFVDVEAIVWGSVNDEEGVTASDALLVLQCATGKAELTGEQRAAANVDGKGGVTANDALMILQYATEKIASFPVQI